MALIPTKRQLGPLDQLAQRPQFAPERNFEARANANMAEAVSGVGDALTGFAADRKQAADKATAYETAVRFKKWENDRDAGANELITTAQPGAPALGDTFGAFFEKDKKAFLETVPANLRPQYEAAVEDTRGRLGSKITGYETSERTRFEGARLDDVVNGEIIKASSLKDTAQQAAIRADAERLIDQNPYLSPVERDKRKRQIADQFAVGIGNAINADPEANARIFVPSPGSASLPAGMRNNNPGNIKFVPRSRFKGVVGPSQNTDQGDRQAVFETPEAGMRAAYELAARKYEGGKTTANELIAGQGGWTPGNKKAAANIAANMGIGPDDDLNLKDRNGAARFLRALVKQEHGNASAAYSDDMILSAVSNETTGSIEQAPNRAPARLPIATRQGSSAKLEGVKADVIDRFGALQDTWGKPLPINSGHRDVVTNKRAGGANKSQHISGNALDVDVSSLSKEERTQLIGMASKAGFTGIGVYNNAIHLDMGARRSWGPNYHADSVPDWARGAVQAHLSGQGQPSQGPAMPERPSMAQAQAFFAQNNPGASVDVIQRLAAQSVTARTQNIERENVQLRVQLDTATDNAPVAIQNTGGYSGELPTADQFIQAYGADGVQRYRQFATAVEVSQSAYEMKTMPSGQIQQLVQAAKPSESGADAALDQRRYDTLSSAAATIIKAREADPATYVRDAFPNVRAAWDSVDRDDPSTYSAALKATASAQTVLGIPPAQQVLLPKEVAERSVATFKDQGVPAAQRATAILSTVLTTPDKGQRQAIFNQLVGAGLPDITEGALDAAARGDSGAAQRLMTAALTNPGELPGKVSETTAGISDAIQTSLLAEGAVGDIYYGLSDGSADNLLRAQRDAKLISNAVQIRLRNGEDLTAAVESAGKDLYGDVQVVNETNAQILLPKDADVDTVVSGLDRAIPDVRAALDASLVAPDGMDGTGRAIVDASTSVYKDRVLAEGYFRNADEGYVFIDPITGGAVSDPAGKPIIFQPKEPTPDRITIGASIASPATEPGPMADDAPLTDDAFVNFQNRMKPRVANPDIPGVTR